MEAVVLFLRVHARHSRSLHLLSLPVVGKECFNTGGPMRLLTRTEYSAARTCKAVYAEGPFKH